MKTVNARRRWLGTFFLLIALLLLIDWGIALLFHMFHIGSGVALLLRIHQIHRGVFSGIGMVLCPGNGFAAFCGPLWLLLYFLFVVQVVVAPVFNRTRARRLNQDEPYGLMTRRSREANLVYYASLLNLAGFIYLSLSAFFSSGLPIVAYLQTGTNTTMWTFISALSIPVCGSTGLYLLRHRAGN